VDLARAPGHRVIAVLGRNRRAGQDTAVRILATLLRADAGKRRGQKGSTCARTGQTVPGEHRADRQVASVDEDLTGTQKPGHDRPALTCPGAPRGKRADELLEWFDLTQARTSRQELLGRACGAGSTSPHSSWAGPQ